MTRLFICREPRHGPRVSVVVSMQNMRMTPLLDAIALLWGLCVPVVALWFYATDAWRARPLLQIYSIAVLGVVPLLASIAALWRRVTAATLYFFGAVTVPVLFLASEAAVTLNDSNALILATLPPCCYSFPPSTGY